MKSAPILLFLFSFVQVKSDSYEYFDRFSGDALDHVGHNITHKVFKNCTIQIKPCAAHEGSRVDGTCNNFNYPSRGSANGPYLRLLNPDYFKGKQIRMDRNGHPLPSARKVRTVLQSTGRVVDKITFNMAAVHLFGLVADDVSFLKGSLDFIKKKEDCCSDKELFYMYHDNEHEYDHEVVKSNGTEATNSTLKENNNSQLKLAIVVRDKRSLDDGLDQDMDPTLDDQYCIPIYVPNNDPLHRLTNIRCLNMTRAETFQDLGCLQHESEPEPINEQTPLLDLSTIYGTTEKEMDRVRQFRDGLLKMEVRTGRYVPLGDEGNKTCIGNRNTTKINETICYRFGKPEIGNIDLRSTTFLIFFMREHNRIAKTLKHINPCWKDDRLFKVARQINIATLQNIYMYELLPVLMGRKHMVHYGLIRDHVQHIKGYDEHSVPLIYTEYDIGVRFFRTWLDGRIKMYKENYHYSGEFSISDTLFRMALLEQNSNIEEINRGSFYQNAAKIDDIQDPDIAETFFAELQKAADLPAIDIQRGRDLGVRGYNDYRHICGMHPAKKFEDFSDVMDYEKVETLKHLYEDIEDVDLLAGIISESFIKGTFVGPTLFCIMERQMRLWMKADRFWFERGDQYHSFNLLQLSEIRRTNMARFACDNADGIKFMQPQALLNVGHGNDLQPCSHISGADLGVWKDHSCQNNEGYHDSYKQFAKYLS